METKTAIIAGAGVAGLTAADTFLTETGIRPIIFETTEDIGGISKTVRYKGNRMDIGGHRFFSKSDRIMAWWERVLPVAEDPVEGQDDVMLVRSRVSRILFLKKFFDYPIKLNMLTIRNLGFIRIMKIGISYLVSVLFPIRKEKSLEDFFINRFGKELYKTFFKDYTEKVWGVPCSKIKPEWGAQRIKGINIMEIIHHALKTAWAPKSSQYSDVAQKEVETSLINRFLYPKYGVGQMWEAVADRIRRNGGEIQTSMSVTDIQCRDNHIVAVKIADIKNHTEEWVPCDYFLSTMPIRELIKGMGSAVPEDVRIIAEQLEYRDFISVGVLLKHFKLGSRKGSPEALIPDNWIYVQENSVKMGRIQIFNNWSPYLVHDEETVWIGLEYFCNEGDEFWSSSDETIIAFAIRELIALEAAEQDDILDATVVRMPKAYPSYIGAYESFGKVRQYLDCIDNLFLIGRNGMHRYNNMDHSMLTAMLAVENINNGITYKGNIWDVNTEEEYHEEKSSS